MFLEQEYQLGLGVAADKAIAQSEQQPIWSEDQSADKQAPAQRTLCYSDLSEDQLIELHQIVHGNEPYGPYQVSRVGEKDKYSFVVVEDGFDSTSFSDVFGDVAAFHDKTPFSLPNLFVLVDKARSFGLRY